MLFQLQDILMKAIDDLMDEDLSTINSSCHLFVVLEGWYD
jgi:hypothetical protein